MRLLVLLTLLTACRRDPNDFKPEPVDTGGEPVADADGDGFTVDEGDCDDADAGVYPGASDACDGLDNDCDGETDEDGNAYYADTDGDGYGDYGTQVRGCEAPDGYVVTAGDCDETDATVYPGAPETCTDEVDKNCDGSVGYADADGDGVAACEECNDGDASVYPGAAELCDGIDQDCDGAVDEDAVDVRTWYVDADGDGWGGETTVTGCEAPAGYVEAGGDCDDADATRFPTAPEEDCTDPVDYNCDGSVGYADADGDGFAACSECDDGDAAVFPGAAEVCNDVDDDCNGAVDDDAAGAATWYRDADADGYGAAGRSAEGCEAPAGYVADATDCDDANSAMNPGADERCNGLDDDCDGDVDEEDAVDAATWYGDVDGDGYGDPVLAAQGCEAPSGYVADATDCDDGDAATNPGADEVCDGADQDCDGTADEDPTDGTTYWLDDDCDGAGGGASVTACESPGEDWVEVDGDCDDADATSGATGLEVCDGADNDCDGVIDDGCVDVTLIGGPSGDPVESPAAPGACALVGEMPLTADVHSTANLPTYMAVLDGTTSGLVASELLDVERLDWSARCGSDAEASIGNYAPTTPWPTLAATSTAGAARFRGYLNIGCDDPLNVTLGLIGNDALSLSIEGATIVEQNWGDGQWKKFRYVSFPGPGLYAFEVSWQTNLVCEIDPFELVWAEGFVAGYDDYDTMCAFGSCTYGNGVEIPGFSVITDTHLVQTTTGAASSCEQCTTDADCSAGTCNSAGLCE